MRNRILLLVLSVTLANPRAIGQGEPAEDAVEVVAVTCSHVPSNHGRWWVMSVLVAARPSLTGPRFVPRVRVAVELAVEVGRTGEKAFECFRADATAVALRPGRSVFRFYLPPEIVERDRVGTDLALYFVEAAVDGRAQAPRPAQIGAGIRSADALAVFRARVSAESPRNEGVLRNHAAVAFDREEGRMPTLVVGR